VSAPKKACPRHMVHVHGHALGAWLAAMMP